jgi:hypothetical protein
MLFGGKEQSIPDRIQDDRRIDPLLFAEHFDGLKNSFHLSLLSVS